MRALFLTDRLSLRGGADQHLLQVIRAAARFSGEVVVACGRRSDGVELPSGVDVVRCGALAVRAASTSDSSGLSELDELLSWSEVVHAQNVMNPSAIEAAVATGRALVTVQDHRVFCPGPGKTLPDGSACGRDMSDTACSWCLPDKTYRRRMLDLTTARRDALRGARLLVLSSYMSDELVCAGLPGAEVMPPWVPIRETPIVAGTGFVIGGRLVRHKGVVDAWQAWRRAGGSHPLLVAGQGSLLSELRGADVRGWLDRLELQSTLAGARATLFPSRWQEPFGILGVESLAAGTPVVVADVGGTREWSDAGCLRVPAGDVEAMAAAISRLAAEPGRAFELARTGRAMVAERFARSPIEARLQRVYREVARTS